MTIEELRYVAKRLSRSGEAIFVSDVEGEWEPGRYRVLCRNCGHESYRQKPIYYCRCNGCGTEASFKWQYFVEYMINIKSWCDLCNKDFKPDEIDLSAFGHLIDDIYFVSNEKEQTPVIYCSRKCSEFRAKMEEIKTLEEKFNRLKTEKMGNEVLALLREERLERVRNQIDNKKQKLRIEMEDKCKH